MNRQQRRRAARAERRGQTPCSSCGDLHKPKTASPMDGKARCPVCHKLHTEHVGGEEAGKNVAKAARFQQKINQAVQQCFPEFSREDLAIVLGALGGATALFALQNGTTKSEFLAAMGEKYHLMHDELAKMLGEQMPKGLLDEDAPPDTEPSGLIIAP